MRAGSRTWAARGMQQAGTERADIPATLRPVPPGSQDAPAGTAVIRPQNVRGPCQIPAGKGEAPAVITPGPARRAGEAAYATPSKTPENRTRRSRFRILPLAFLGSSVTIAKCLGLL